MSAPTLRIPESVADDPSDVADALEVASALWGKGQSEEAIRWLRRAVAAASEADDAVRAAGLAGAAADLEDTFKQPSVAPPASRAPTESTAAPSAAAAPAEAKAEPAVEASALPAPTAASPADALARAALPPVPSHESRDGHHAPHDAHDGHRAPHDAHDAHDTHDAAEPTLPDSPAAMSIYANGAPSVPPRASSVPAPRSTFAKPPVIHPTHSPTALPELPARMRVSVKTSVRDVGLLFVRALADGEEAPPGTVEAFLVREVPEANADTHGQDEGTPEESGP